MKDRAKTVNAETTDTHTVSVCPCGHRQRLDMNRWAWARFYVCRGCGGRISFLTLKRHF